MPGYDYREICTNEVAEQDQQREAAERLESMDRDAKSRRLIEAYREIAKLAKELFPESNQIQAKDDLFGTVYICIGFPVTTQRLRQMLYEYFEKHQPNVDRERLKVVIEEQLVQLEAKKGETPNSLTWSSGWAGMNDDFFKFAAPVFEKLGVSEVWKQPVYPPNNEVDWDKLEAQGKEDPSPVHYIHKSVKNGQLQTTVKKHRGGREGRYDLSQLECWHKKLHPTWRDAAKLYKQIRPRKNWQKMMKAAFPDLPDDLIERLSPTLNVPDDLLAQMEKCGHTASAIAYEHAARRCGAEDWAFVTSHLAKTATDQRRKKRRAEK